MCGLSDGRGRAKQSQMESRPRPAPRLPGRPLLITCFLILRELGEGWGGSLSSSNGLPARVISAGENHKGDPVPQTCVTEKQGGGLPSPGFLVIINNLLFEWPSLCLQSHFTS